MLMKSTHTTQTGLRFSALLLVFGLLLGTLLGRYAPALADPISQYTDVTLMTLIVLLFFSVPLKGAINHRHKLSVLLMAVTANFLIVPFIGYGLAWLFLSDYPLLMIGLTIYFIAPCTDWFLGFTRLCQGDTLLGTALLPINMGLQLLLYPVYLSLFGHNIVELEAGLFTDTLISWFIQPLLIAAAARLLVHYLLPAQIQTHLQNGINRLIPVLIALLILQIFAGNVQELFSHLAVFGWLLLAVFCFFVLTFLLSELISKLFGLPYGEHVLLTMTIAARNAPLMLAITMAAFPSQPLIYAAIVIGMLLEFPHLTALSHLLLRSRQPKTEKALA